MGLLGRISVQVYDVIKTVITAILVIMIVLMLLRFNGPVVTETPTPAPVARAAATPTAPPTPTVPPTPPATTVGPPEIRLPDRGVEPGEEIVLEGAAPGADKIQVVIDGQELSTIDVGPDGQWSMMIEFGEPGDHEIQVRALDASGAVVADTTGTLFVDAGVAPLKVGVPVWGEWKPVDEQRSAAGFKLLGQGDPGATVQVWIDAASAEEPLATAQVGADGAWLLEQDVTQTFGPHELTIEMVDAAGRPLETSGPIPFVVPTPAPPTPTATPAPTPTPSVPAPAITFPVDGEVVRAGPLGLRGTGAAGLEIEVLDNEAVAGSAAVAGDGTWRFEYELSEGDHTLVARVASAPDAAGESVRILSIPGEIVCPLVVPPAESKCPPDPPAGEDRGDEWVVGWCETLGLIARRAGVTVGEIMAVNPEICNPNLIREGQVLKLPPRE